MSLLQKTQDPPVIELTPLRRAWGHWQVRFIAGRLAQSVLVLFGAVTVSFLLVHLTGNPAQVIAGGMVSQAQVHRLSAQLGYNRPLLVQYADFIGKTARGDFGYSFRYHEPAITPVLQALPNTLILVFGAIGLGAMIAVPLAVLSVLRRDSALDGMLRRALILGQGVPEYWLGLLLLLAFAIKLHLLPSLGFHSPESVILPIVTLAVPPASMFTRMLRGGLLDFADSALYVALRSKGLPDTEILFRHGLRNALPPFLNFVGLELGWLVGGTIIAETVFVWPGIGYLLLSAVSSRDLLVIQSIIVIVAVGYVLINLAVDVIVAAIDPRVREAMGGG